MNKERLEMAILMVNGTFNYKNHLWIELSIDRIIRHTSPYTKYKIFLWNHDYTNPEVNRYLHSRKEYVEVLHEENFALSHWKGIKIDSPAAKTDYFGGGYHVHRGALQMLYESALSKYDINIIFTFDSDSFPIRDNWEIPLVYHLKKDIELIGVWRDELQVVIPPFIHASGLGIKTKTVSELNLRFDYEPIPPLEDTLSHFTKAVRDHFGPRAILPLKRSNASQYHSVFNGVYGLSGGIIYHHHLGTRYRDGKADKPKTYGWQERGESLEFNKFILDGTTHRVFEQTGDFIDELVYGAKAFEFKLYSNYLAGNKTEKAYDNLFEQAKKTIAEEPWTAYYLAGLIGKHFANNHVYLQFYAGLCEALGYHAEAESYFNLAGLHYQRQSEVRKNDTSESLGLGKKPGDLHYRAYVGPPSEYDLIAAMTFNLLTTIGLRQHHHLLDIGCGSLRVGRLLIPYLNANCYTGIEPNEWLVKEGIHREMGDGLMHIKQPHFFFSGTPDVLPTNLTLDFVVAQSIFSHGTEKFIERWLSGIFPYLNSHGVILATFKQDNKDFSHPDGINEADFVGDGWIYPKCVSYRPETIKQLAVKNGYRFQILDWKHPRQTWALFARENFDTSWFTNKPLTWNNYSDYIFKNKKM
ncbi:MAG TPA: hypothetical protein VK469_15530 [Candidatus Kapabacteria bacterium]|nr:hypothetical protein [Candidatus Kapabacteria bacterium]